MLAAVGADDPVAKARAMDSLVRAYHRPVYMHLRLRHREPEERARDLVQEFFSRALASDSFADFDPERGRFRNYLKVLVDRFAVKARVAERRKKRGGGAQLVSLDLDPIEADVRQLESTTNADSFDSVFDREWLRSVITLTVNALEEHCRSSGREDRFRVFEKVALADEDERPSYADVATSLGIKPTDVTNYLHYARKKFRSLLEQTLRELTASERELREELTYFLGPGPRRPAPPA